MPTVDVSNTPVVVEATNAPAVVESTEQVVTVETTQPVVVVEFGSAANLVAGEGLTGGGVMQGTVNIRLSDAAQASLELADSALQPGDNVSALANNADYQSGAQVTAAINALGTVYQPLDADLSAVAALNSAGIAVRTAANTWALRTIAGVTNQTEVTNGSGAAGNPTVGLAAAALASLALANSAAQPGANVSIFTNDAGYQTYGQVLVLIAAAGAGYQPIDSDLTAIAALTTTTFGRSLLTMADAAATRTTLSLVPGTDVQAYSAKLAAYAGGDTPSAFTLGIVDSADAAAWRTALAVYSTTQVDTALSDAAAAVAAGYQPLDSDLTAIAALTTTSFGRGLLALADAAALRAAVDLEPGIDVQAYSAVLDAYAASTPDAFSLGLMSLTSGAAWRAAIGAGTPVSPSALTRTNDANVTLTLGGVPATALLAAVSLTLGWDGTLSKPRGGFGEDASALTTTIAELNYVDGVTSAIQTQLDAKQDFSSTLAAYAAGGVPSPYSLTLMELTDATAWWTEIGGGVLSLTPGPGIEFDGGTTVQIDYTHQGLWQAPIAFENQDTATADEIYWAMRVVDDPGVWRFYARSDDDTTRAPFFRILRGTGVSIAQQVYGNGTDNPAHDFYGSASFNAGTTSAGLTITGNSVENWLRLSPIGGGTATGNTYLASTTTGGYLWQSNYVMRWVETAGVIVDMFYGNDTDGPSHTAYGDIFRIQYSGTSYVSFRLSRTGGTASDWEMYMPASSTDLRWYGGGADRLVLTAAGLLTVPGTFTVTGAATFNGTTNTFTSSVHGVGWAGIRMLGADQGGGVANQDLIARRDSGGTAEVGVYNATAGAWQFHWVNGVLSAGTVPAARTSGFAAVATSGSATDLSTGTLADARLSSNVPLLNANNYYTGYHRSTNFLEVTGWGSNYYSGEAVQLGVSANFGYVHTYNAALGAPFPLRIYASQIDLLAPYVLVGGYRTIDNSADTWLRLNQAGHYSSGVYTPYNITTDSAFSVGSYGGFFAANGTTSYTPISVGGAKGGYSGFYFVDEAIHLMVDSAGAIGWYTAAGSWLWYINGSGVLQVGTVPYARLSGVGDAATCNASSSNLGGYVVLRDANGDHTSRYVNASYFYQSSPLSENPTIAYMIGSSDNYHRWCTIAHVAGAVRSLAGVADYFWSNSHPASYYLENNWDGTYWRITSNHGSGVRVAYADNAGGVGGGTLEALTDVDYIGGPSSGDFLIYDTGLGGWYNESRLTVIGIINPIAYFTYSTNSTPTGTNSSWTTYPLDTSVSNTISSASLSSNQITLPNGKYKYTASFMFHECNGQMRLYNHTSGAVVHAGPRWDFTQDATCAGVITMTGVFSISGGSTALSFQYYKDAGNLNQSDGDPGSTAPILASVVIEVVGN